MTRQPKLLIMSLLLAACVLTQGYAQEAQEPSYRTAVFQLDSSMIRFDAPSTSLFLGWQSDAHALLHLGLDGVTAVIHVNPAADALLRAGTLALFSGAGLIVSQAFSLTAHDQSHMEAASAIGATDVGLVRSSNGQPMSIWEFFWEAFNFTEEPGLYTYFKSNPTLTELAYVSGEGLDTNMLIAERVSRKITEGEGHVTDLAPYLLNKLWGINYFSVTGPTSDAENYMNLVNAQGHGSVSRTNVIGLSAASCLLSGGFLSLAKGTWSYVFAGESAVTPLRARIGEVSLFWPELTTWLNPDNVSLLVMAEGAWKDAAFVRVGVDTPVMGNTAQNPELTVGTRVKIERLSVGLEITSRFSGLPFFLAGTELDLNDTFTLEIEGYYGERNTMRELREYPRGPGATCFLRAKFS